MADFKVHLGNLFLQHSKIHEINRITQLALGTLFVNGSYPKISGLIKSQKVGFETTGLTELLTVAEHFEKTLEQDQKQKSTKVFTF